MYRNRTASHDAALHQTDLFRSSKNLPSRTFSSAAEALEFYKLDWIAECQPLVTGAGINVESHKAIVRNDTNSVIGIVGRDYLPIQNNDAFAMFDVLCKKHGARWNRAGSFYGGSKVYLQATIGKGEVKVGDIVENRITIFNAFDGSHSYEVDSTPYRLVCANGMRAMDRSRAIKVCIRHTKNAMYRYEEALRVFGIAQKEFETFIETSRALAQKLIDKDKVVRLIREAFDVPSEQKNDEIPPAKRARMNQVFTLYQSGKGNEGRSLYDFVNGVTEFVDHYSGRQGEAGEMYAMIGRGARLKEHANELAFAELNR